MLLTKQEYFAGYADFLSWKMISGSEEDLAKFASLALRDMENSSKLEFHIEDVICVYAFSWLTDAGLEVLTENAHWTVFSSLGVFDVEHSEPISEFFLEYLMEEMQREGWFKAYQKIDLSLMKKYLAYDAPATGEQLLATGGMEAVFRAADDVDEFCSGWAAFHKGSVCGYVSPDGKFLAGDWNNIRSFDSETGTAAVYKGSLSPYGNWPYYNQDGTTEGVFGLIDAKGELVLPMEYDYIEGPYMEGYAVVHLKDGTYLGYDVANRSWIQPEDPSVSYLSHVCKGGLIPAFSGELNGESSPGRNSSGKWGFIDKSGKTAIPFEFDSIEGFWVSGMTAAKKNEKYGAIDRNGKTLIPFTWDSVSLKDDCILAKKNDNYYLIDAAGSILVNLNAEYAYYEGYDLIDVYSSDTGSGLVDRNGNVVLPREWSGLHVIDENRAVVSKKRGDGTVSGLINIHTREFLLPIEYDKFGWEVSDGLRAYCQLGYWGYMDEDFRIVIPAQYVVGDKYSTGNDFRDGFACVKDENEGWIIIDTAGHRVF